jgi:phosphoserine phosphatase
MKNLICFDLDGTLTAHSTWEAFNTRLGITPEEDFRLFNLYTEGKLEYHDWITALVKLYKEKGAVSKSDIEAVAHEIVIRPEAQVAIDDAKAKGYHVIIISGGIDVIAQAIASKLGVEELFTANKAIFNEGNELIDIEHSGHERDVKRSLLESFCSKHGYQLSEVITVGDGGNDLELFKVTKGILLGNNKELAPIAWKQIDSLSELSDLL